MTTETTRSGRHRTLARAFLVLTLAAVVLSFLPVWGATPSSAETIRFGPGSNRYEGTMALPDPGRGLHPTLLLITEGPAPPGDEPDRDQLLVDSLVIGLAGRGVLTLAITPVMPLGPPAVQFDTTAVDRAVLQRAEAALDYLRRREDVDPERIFVAGHGVAGSLTQILASRQEGLAGIALLAAPSRPLSRVISEQIRYRSRLADEATRPVFWEQLRLLALATEGRPIPDTTKVLGLPLSFVLDFERRDPVGVARRQEIPTYVAQGGRDFETTTADFEIWKSALSENPWTTFQFYADLNHLFQKGIGSSVPQEYRSADPPAREVIDDLAAWVLRK